MTVLLQVSDPHRGAERPTAVDALIERVAALLEAATAAQLRVVVVHQPIAVT